MPIHGNTFMGGMDKDTSKQKYPNNKYYDAKNLRPVTDEGLSTGALENIKGNEEILQMSQISGMLVITASGESLSSFTLDITLTSGIVYNITITSPSTLDNVFDQIESFLTTQSIVYQRLSDEDRIVIYNTANGVTSYNLAAGTPISVEILPAASQFVVIGHTPLREKTILFTVNEGGSEVLSQIWSMSYDPTDPKGTAIISLLYNGRLEFSKDHPIEALARYENSETQRVYFTDNYNIPRTFNAVRKDTLALRAKDFALIIENEIVPPLVTTEDQDGGTLPTGLWYTTYRLKKFGGASTPIAPFSGATAVTTSTIDTSNSDPKYWDYAYATTIVNSTKILNYTIPSIPVGFDEIAIYAVNETAPGQYQAFLVKVDTLTSELSYDFTLSTITDLEEIPIEELKQYDVDFERVKTLTAKYNRLLFGNVKEASFNIDFDARAYRFTKSFIGNLSNTSYVAINTGITKTWGIDESEDAINPINRDSTALQPSGAPYNYLYKRSSTSPLGGSGPNVSYEFIFKEVTLDDSSNVEPSNLSTNIRNKGTAFWPEISPFVNMPAKDEIEVEVNGETIDVGAGFSNFKNGRIESYFKGYMRDEVYRFGLVFYSKTGRASDVKWIGDIRMPSAGDFGKVGNAWEGAIAQWYSKDIAGFSNNASIPKNNGETKGWMLGLKFTVDLSNYIDLVTDTDIRDNISGFSIVRAPRRQKDKTIIAEGALGEIASKKVFSRQTGADYLFRNIFKKVDFKGQINTTVSLPEYQAKYVNDYTGINTEEWWTPDGQSTLTGAWYDFPMGGGAWNNTLWGLIPVDEEQWDPGANYTNSTSPSPGFFYEVPETGKYDFTVGTWVNFSYNSPKDVFAIPPYNPPIVTDILVEGIIGFARIRGGNVENLIEEKYFYPFNNNIIKSHINDKDGDTGSQNIMEFHDASIDCQVGDKIMAIGRWRVKVSSSGGSLNYSFGDDLNLKSKFNPNDGTNATIFQCKGFSGVDGDKNKRLFNLTRVIDGGSSTETDNTNNPTKYGGPNIRNGYNFNVIDDWSLANSPTNMQSNTSDHYTNVGNPEWQYATLDCPDLKFPTGTKVSNYYETDSEDQKYVIKPVAGYVHISEDNPTITDGSFTGDNSLNYDSDSSVMSNYFSEIGHLYSAEKWIGGISPPVAGTQRYESVYSRYSKSLALCHGVSFQERLHFSTGDSYGKVQELSKIENAEESEVRSLESLSTTVTPEDVRFLNVGFSTNVWEGFRFEQAGSALISPGVFTVFTAGANENMTKYLLNYAFGESANKDKDPYLGNGTLDYNNTPAAFYSQHNNYQGDGNKIGFYDKNGSGIKIPRRGQTAIVDICRELDKQYGGNTYKERKNTDYISTGHFTKVTKDTGTLYESQVFGGDIFQSAMAEKKLYSTSWTYEAYTAQGDTTTTNNGAGALASSPVVGRIYPIQSVVNVNNRVGYHFNNFQNYSTPFRTQAEEDDLLLSSGFPVDQEYEAKRDDYLCPVLYSREKELQTYLVTGQNALLSEYDNRAYMSQQKLNGELFDSWTVFKPLDYMDVDGHYGPINKLEVFNNEVLFFQDKSFGILALNPQSIITDSSGGEVQLGTGKGLVTFRYISNSVGAFHQWGIVKGKAAMYFFDAYHRKFFRYSSKGPEPISDTKGMSSWFFDKIDGSILTNDNPILYKGITAVYDQRFSEAIFTFHAETPSETGTLPGGAAGKLTTLIPAPYTLAFNEMVDSFTSFYSHHPQHYISDSKRIFSQPPSGYPIYMHDEGVRGVFYGNTAVSIIELIVNPKGDWTKVFNNLEYVTQASDSNGDLVDVTFDRLKVSNEYQDTGSIALVVNDNVKRRMRTWRSQVPRDGNARIRNPHMRLKFEYDNNPANRRLIIHDILTHYMDAPM